ncbi:DUF885 family protein [Parasphingopyxis sp.]|uniref:DUF885 domain-containing protein n=1 Tax=Parasphingopyxis sp. TaxID=1920299 RepID=UPI00261D41AA|nr:DUF885 domain-containing protein [Parasphingopyxis sp.]
MKRKLLMLASAAALPLFATPAYADHHAEAPAAEAEMTEDQRLRALFAASDEDNLRRNPIMALFRGDMRYADRIGDFISDEYFDGERAAAEANLAALAEIDRSALSQTNQIAYDIFRLQQEENLRDVSPELMALTVVRPVNHFSGFHTFYPTFASGQGAAPFNTVEDYENNLSRHQDFITISDRSIERFRQGMESGVFESQLTIGRVVEQLDTQLAEEIADSPYFRPALNFPEGFSEEDQARLTNAYRESTQAIFDAYTRMRDFLRDEYLPVAREGVGLVHMRGGDVVYAQMVRDTTTLDLTPDFIHDLGLAEVARITRGFEEIRDEVGFEGTLQEFFEHIRTDPQFKPESREWLAEEYYRIGERVDQRISELFSTIPNSPLEIRAVEPFREATAAGGSYQPGTPDGSRPGVFYYNAYNLDERLTPGMETLYLHEAAPGHHFQISLAQENADLPNFMRFGGNTAYVEGWALYTETLGPELGIFTDPYQRFGHLNDEMLRAMRLVVDTGLHAKGWTREQAIQYMLDNSGMTNVEATSEVERYIAIPSQALAYKIGSLTIQALRAQAEEALGDNFDIRGFHEQVLDTGALPMAVLEDKIYDWIEANGGTRPGGIDLMAVHDYEVAGD